MGVLLGTSDSGRLRRQRRMTLDRDTYMVVKRTAQVGFGPPGEHTKEQSREFDRT
jgi:hypothetical protein